jgi:hypothetical protein
MATSDSIDFNDTALEIITGAYEDLGVLDIEGSGPSTAELNLALKRLNRMLKMWQTKGLLWQLVEGRIFLEVGKNEYLLPGANACIIDELVETTLSADEASGQTELSVTSVTGIAAADVIGIVQSDNTIHWTTVGSVASTVTVTDALTASASSGAKVYAYTNAAPRALKIIAARRKTGDTEIPMGSSAYNSGPMAREEYFNLPNKTSPGTPVQYYYDPKLDTGRLYFWPTPNIVTDVVNYTFLSPLEDIDASSNNFDLPIEWHEVISANLAIRLAPSMGKSVPPEIIEIASGIEDLEMWDSEEVGVTFYAE